MRHIETAGSQKELLNSLQGGSHVEKSWHFDLSTIGAAITVAQPTVADAADWHDRDRRGHERYDRDRGHERYDRDRRHENRDWRAREDWDRRAHRRDYLHFNYAPGPSYYAPHYYAPAPHYANPYYGSPYAYPNAALSKSLLARAHRLRSPQGATKPVPQEQRFPPRNGLWSLELRGKSGHARQG